MSVAPNPPPQEPIPAYPDPGLPQVVYPPQVPAQAGYPQQLPPQVGYPQPIPPQAGYPQQMPVPGYPQPMVAPAPPPTTAVAPVQHHEQMELIIYSHSNFLYWWPVWAVGFLMAALTRFQGVVINIGGVEEYFHPNKNIGVIFMFTLLAVILFTNFSMRGTSSVIAILTLMFVALFLAYMDWWAVIIGWLPYLSVHVNFGFYLVFSSAVFLGWFISVFIHDHLHYWRVRPGQMTYETVIGAASKSYDTRGLEFEKQQQDLFRHWILGLGSGDIRIITGSGHREEFVLTNVMFVSAKVREIQRLIAVKPGNLAEETGASPMV
jgi:hypothetical protein